MVSLIQHFEADFLRKVSLKILNLGIILKKFTHALTEMMKTIQIQMLLCLIWVCYIFTMLLSM